MKATGRELFPGPLLSLPLPRPQPPLPRLHLQVHSPIVPPAGIDAHPGLEPAHPSAGVRHGCDPVRLGAISPTVETPCPHGNPMSRRNPNVCACSQSPHAMQITPSNYVHAPRRSLLCEIVGMSDK